MLPRPSIQAVEWALLALTDKFFLVRIVRKKGKKKKTEESLEVCAKLGPRTEELLKTPTPLKTSQGHQRNRKDILRTTQELAELHPFQALGCRGFNAFENTVFEKRI